MNVAKTIIVSGEAPETDSEDETETTKAVESCVSKLHGELISGEDSESENEFENGTLSISSTVPERTHIQKRSYNSLLHKKLRESNIKLSDDLDNFVQSTVDEAKNNVSSMNQQLLKAQLILQGAVSSLRALHSNSVKINSKLEGLSSAFISNININN